MARLQWAALGAAFVTQLPFWIGSMIYFETGTTPVHVNMVTDLSVSAFFVFLAHRFRKAWLIWLGVVFLCMGISDVYASLFGMSFYFVFHVFAHVLALLLIVGRKQIDRVDSVFGHPATSQVD